MINFLLCAKPIEASKDDIMFYIILGILLIAVIVICALFANSKKFKIKKQEEKKKLAEEDAYKAPKVIHVKSLDETDDTIK